MSSFTALFANRYLRLLLVAIAIAMCVWAIQTTARFGFSRLFLRYALVTRSLEAAQAATEMTPRDPQAHITSATLSNLNNSHDETLASVEKAVALRPADYSLWVALGLTRDQVGNTAGALAAFDQAIARAPFYSQPHWQRGNLLLRAGQYEAAFKDLNQAAQSNPDLIPRLIDIAWALSKRDAALTESMLQVKSSRMRIAFAQLLAREGKAEEAVSQWKAAGVVADDLQREMIRQLLAKHSYKEAFVIWKAAEGSNADASASLLDGGFEGQLVMGAEGFGWRVPGNLKGANLSVDATDKNSGAKSLVINFQGALEQTPLSQLVIVEPSGHYKLNFAARSSEIVSGGPPIIAVDDSVNGKRLVQSGPLSKGTAGWQVFSVEFDAPAATTAVVVSIQREPCSTSPCPIFGSLSLDSFSLERLK